MFKNIGATDRVVRVVVGIGVAVIGIVFHSWWGLLALIPFGTALAGFCPLYAPFRLSTAKVTTAKVTTTKARTAKATTASRA